MRLVPALQLADFCYAWCFSHKKAAHRFEWQRRILRQGRWTEEFADYPKLVKILPGIADMVRFMAITASATHALATAPG